MKKVTALILICCSLTVLWACGKNNAIPGPDYEEESAKQDERKEASEGGSSKEKREDDNRKANTKQNADDREQAAESDEAEWKNVYLSYLDKLEGADTCTYSLIYVDEDDIPELVIDTGFEAGGCMILTFHDGVLDGWQSSRLNVTYIEKGNLICNSDGNMGYYYDSVFTIRNGKWCYVDGGQWGDGPDGPQLDENDDYLYVYRWDGEDVSEEEYRTRLNEVYPLEQQVYPEKYYILDEICSVIKTGDVTSANHQYELIVEDLTWKEAQALCRKKGGYLATITSWEEMERIQEQIVSEDKTDITFFVGANNEEEDGAWGYHWIEPETGAVYNMLGLYNALFQFWLEGEPSYTGLTESGQEVDEDYVVLFYRKSDDKFYLNDVPNDILSAAPSYSGKVGYICEYESGYEE